MKITVERFGSNKEATLSTISIDGIFSCFGLEDQHQETKVVGETRIPAGKYKMGVRKVGGFHKKYSRRFNAFHQGMLQVLKVPDFEFILLHVGNDDDDTAGCLILGKVAHGYENKMVLGDSTRAYKELYQKVIKVAQDGELEIEYIDKDRPSTQEQQSLVLSVAPLPHSEEDES